MKKLLVVLGIVVFGIFKANAQYDYEALKFSQSFLLSDARSISVGNAFGAVGANFASSYINPAGLALYRRGEMNFSLGFGQTSNFSTYLGNTNESRKTNASIPSIGFVFTDIIKKNGQEVQEGWVSTSLAFGINRTNSFHYRGYFSGVNEENSILDFYTQSAQGEKASELNVLTAIAYDTWLINNPFSNDITNYISALGTDTSIYKINQSCIYSTRGSAYDMNISFAGNYSNFIYIGGKIGIPFLDYSKSYTFSEENQRLTTSNYVSSELVSTTDLSGKGINGSLGIIVKPSEFFRIGGSVTSPTFYKMERQMLDRIYSVLDTMTTSPKTLEGSFNYSLSTPFKLTASAAVILGEYGFVSLDYEFIDYSSAFLSSNSEPFIFENKNIETFFTSANNIRLGAELKFGIFALRGGYGIFGTPYMSQYKPEKGDQSYSSVSFGAGIRDKDYFIDIAYQKLSGSEFELPYALSGKEVQGAVHDLSSGNVVMTIGLKL